MEVNTINEAVDMVEALMEGDAATFKRGYTFENAVLAVADVSDFEAWEIEKATELRHFDAYHRFLDRLTKH